MSRPRNRVTRATTRLRRERLPLQTVLQRRSQFGGDQRVCDQLGNAGRGDRGLAWPGVRHKSGISELSPAPRLGLNGCSHRWLRQRYQAPCRNEVAISQEPLRGRGVSSPSPSHLGEIQVMLMKLSQRTYDLMQRALAAVGEDGADLITTLVASAFIDGQRDEPDQRSVDQDAERDE